MQERTCSLCGEKETQPISKLQHAYGEWTVVKEPTCKEEGLQERTCSLCGEKETQPISKLQHAYGEWITVKEANCQEEGRVESYCIHCKEMQYRVIPKTEHNYGDWMITDESTCQTHGHRQKVCERCGDTISEELPLGDHRYDESGHCVNCGKQVGESECTHTQRLIVSVEGGHAEKCAVCGKLLSEVSPHDFDSQYTSEELDGEHAHGRRCMICGEVIIEKCTLEISYTVLDGYEREKCHVTYCTVCQNKYEYQEHSFWRSEMQNYPKVCEECGYQLVCNNHYFNDKGVCNNCGYVCPHENKTIQQTTHLSYTADNKMIHSYYCSDCNNTVEAECTFENGVCTACQGTCPHGFFIDKGEYHACYYCGRQAKHVYNECENCIICGHQCLHEKIENCHCATCHTALHNFGELLFDEEGHYRVCTDCQEMFRQSDHKFDEKGKCEVCGYVSQTISTCTHTPSGSYNSYTEGHRNICANCGVEYGEIIPHTPGTTYIQAQTGEGHQVQCADCYIGFGEVYPHICDSDDLCQCKVCYGYHSHTYDENGVCSTCNHTCTHSGGYVYEDMGHRCIYCQKLSEHKFNENGCCSICQYICQHYCGFTDGACNNCGYKCLHGSYNYMNETEHECSICHQTFAHNYVDGFCAECHCGCPHRFVSVNDATHKCEICGCEQSHIYNINSVKGKMCEYCQHECTHKNHIESENICYCPDCGFEVRHYSEPCPLCGKVCSHSNGFAEISEEGHVCATCYAMIQHTFDEKGYCTVCGYQKKDETATEPIEQ